MQDLRRQPNQEITPELNDLQEEIGAHFTKGRYIVPLPGEGNGIPLVKLKSGDILDVYKRQEPEPEPFQE